MQSAKSSLSVKSLAKVIGLTVIAGLSACSQEQTVEATPEENAALLSRIRPVVKLDDILGKVETAEAEHKAAPAAVSSAATGGASRPGMALYNGACMACHSSGAAGAPKLGDRAAWEPRAATGIDAMLSTSRTGKGAMPPNGGSAYSEAEMRAVIEYMLAEAGLPI